MNGESGDMIVVSRPEACATSTEDGLARFFGDIDVGTADVLLDSLVERIIRRNVRVNKK